MSTPPTIAPKKFFRYVTAQTIAVLEGRVSDHIACGWRPCGAPVWDIESRVWLQGVYRMETPKPAVKKP